MKADQSQVQGMLLEALSRALEHHTWALAQYQDQTQAGCDSDDLEQFKVAVVEPALRDCERLRSLTQNNPDPIYEEERSLVEQLEECHQENLRTFRELSQPRKSMLLKEFTTLAEKATAVQVKCQEIRLALGKHRKERTLVATLS